MARKKGSKDRFKRNVIRAGVGALALGSLVGLGSLGRKQLAKRALKKKEDSTLVMKPIEIVFETKLKNPNSVKDINAARKKAMEEGIKKRKEYNTWKTKANADAYRGDLDYFKKNWDVADQTTRDYAIDKIKTRASQRAIERKYKGRAKKDQIASNYSNRTVLANFARTKGAIDKKQRNRKRIISASLTAAGLIGGAYLGSRRAATAVKRVRHAYTKTNADLYRKSIEEFRVLPNYPSKPQHFFNRTKQIFGGSQKELQNNISKNKDLLKKAVIARNIIGGTSLGYTGGEIVNTLIDKRNETNKTKKKRTNKR